MSSSRTDWLKMPLKFRGKCSACGREIPPGELALWSKSEKKVKHVSCEAPKPDSSAPLAEAAAPAIELDCFVCGRPSGCAKCSMAADCDRTAVSQACICEECFSKGADPLVAYQQEFLKKANKIPKVKI